MFKEYIELDTVCVCLMNVLSQTLCVCVLIKSELMRVARPSSLHNTCPAPSLFTSDAKSLGQSVPLVGRESRLPRCVESTRNNPLFVLSQSRR